MTPVRTAPPRIRLLAEGSFFFRYRFAYGRWVSNSIHYSRHLPGFKRDRGRAIRKWRYATRLEEEKKKKRLHSLYGSAPPGLLTGALVVGSWCAHSSPERTFAGGGVISYRRFCFVFCFRGVRCCHHKCVFVPHPPPVGINGNRDHDDGCQWGM